MCISCSLYARFLTSWKTFIVQCSYAASALVSLSRSAAGRFRCRAARTFSPL